MYKPTKRSLDSSLRTSELECAHVLCVARLTLAWARGAAQVVERVV
jgi:hypothetical protein